MQTLPNEVTLDQSFTGLILTNYRLRSSGESLGKKKTTSIMLEEVCSCELHYKSKPWLLVVAAFFCIVCMIAVDGLGNKDAVAVPLMIAIGFFIAFSASRNLVITLASAGATIELQASGDHTGQALRLIDAIEIAKNHRYMLLCGSNPASATSAQQTPPMSNPQQVQPYAPATPLPPGPAQVSRPQSPQLICPCCNRLNEEPGNCVQCGGAL